MARVAATNWFGACASGAIVLPIFMNSRRSRAHFCVEDPPRRVTVHLTGFGPFGGITENPTSTVCRVLRAFIQAGERPVDICPALIDEFSNSQISVEGMDALEVSAEACRANVQAILQSCERRRREEQHAGIQVIVHLGVSSVSRQMQLECRGINIADFRIPDVAGWQPRGEPVVANSEMALYTSLPLPQILGEMHDRGVSCAISTDAGRYICNYVFYSSLNAAKKLDIPVLFVHMPPFEAMGEGAQVSAVLCLLLAIARQLRGEHFSGRAPRTWNVLG